MNRSLYFFFSIAILLLLSACTENPFSSKIEEGTITYKIEYPSIDDDNVMLDLMPKKMETAISGEDYRTDIIAGMGLFKTSIISKGNEENIIHSVKLLNKKYASELYQNDIEIMSPDLVDVEIEFTNKSKKIAGLKCKEVKFKDVKGNEYLAYYTKSFKIQNPNKGTPFEEIPGVLMEYELVNFDTHMKFIAEEVNEKAVEKNDLALESGYNMVEPVKLKAEIQSIFDKVK